MRQLNRERGLTFLIVTHDISVGRATDRIVRMVDGEIVGDELLQEAQLMVARVTLAEVDAVRMSMDAARRALPRRRCCPRCTPSDGYEGVLRAHHARGQGARAHVLETDEAAEAGLDERPLRASRSRSSSTLFRSPPGRETYDVAIADAPRGRGPAP